MSDAECRKKHAPKASTKPQPKGLVGEDEAFGFTAKPGG